VAGAEDERGRRGAGMASCWGGRATQKNPPNWRK